MEQLQTLIPMATSVAAEPTVRFPGLIESRLIQRDWLERELFPLCDALRNGETVNDKLGGKALFSLFYEPSFLTRHSFERAMSLLGGHAQFTEDASQFFPVRATSSIEDTIRFLTSLHFDAVVIRTNQPGAIQAAAEADVISVINGGSDLDHPTQAMLDVYTIGRELGRVDGIHIAVVGRVDHRNVNALLVTLSKFNDVHVTLVPVTGQARPELVDYCQRSGMDLRIESCIEPFAKDLDAVYVNGAETPAHAQLMLERDLVKVKVDQALLDQLRADCIILDPMQRSESLIVGSKDSRWAGYRQAENGLYVRMAILLQVLGAD